MNTIQLLSRAFPDFDGPWMMARAGYKYTECGATIGFRYAGGWVYGDSNSQPREWRDDITAISTSSIVQGCDDGTETHIIELDGKTAEQLKKEYWDALQQVEHEARDIWMQTHGCETCAKHWDNGQTPPVWQVPVWTGCPDCKGQGVVI